LVIDILSTAAIPPIYHATCRDWRQNQQPLFPPNNYGGNIIPQIPQGRNWKALGIITVTTTTNNNDNNNNS
jgi:hypothetical protein